MNHFKIYGLNCTRIVKNEISDNDILENLKKINDYIYLISYQKVKLKDFSLMEKVTPIIRTSYDEEKIYKNFNQTTRNEINKTYNNCNLEFKDNDNFLKEKIGLLKLRAAEEFMDFLKAEFTGEIKIIENKKGELIEEFFTYKQNFDWNDMKPILISMKKSFHCYDDNQIIFSGKWTSDSVRNAYRSINLEKAYDELLITDIEGERSILDDKKFKKKFPKLWETDDPEYVKNAIKYVIRMRGL